MALAKQLNDLLTKRNSDPPEPMTQFPNTVKSLAVLALVLLVASNAPAFSRATHEWQIYEVFSEKNNPLAG